MKWEWFDDKFNLKKTVFLFIGFIPGLTRMLIGFGCLHEQNFRI